ncbi:MAG TPA: TonB-dependent receptor plug domain-containing protein [Gemmatimonadales bacterium]|nr:TonB-dependent receptor plug domain-containing protein [Gemmatimonadales bacterium]
MTRSTLRPCILLILLAACSSSRQSGSSTSRPSGSGFVITAADIERSPGMSLEQIMIARIPGLSIGRAEDGRMILKLRGTTTFMGSEEALIVVNGIALGPNAAGNLHAINPHDIESITVLRDAASTAQYGSRGANGVIVIRTKSS